jgi:beta-lactamase class A
MITDCQSAHRRDFIMSLGGLSLGTFLAAPARAEDLRIKFSQIERQMQGRLGLSLRQGAQDINYRSSERFLYCSTFKWVLAAAVLSLVDKGQLKLEQTVSYSDKDMLKPSPVTSLYLVRGFMSIGDLCKATVTTSDNTAANLLTPLIGGLAGLKAFTGSLGDTIMRFDRREPELNHYSKGDARDTVTPHAMTGLLYAAFAGPVLSPASKAILRDWMQATVTGKARIRAGVPQDLVVGNKTGSSGAGFAHDVAFIKPHQGETIYLSLFTQTDYDDISRNEIAIAQATRAVLSAIMRA